MYLTDTFTRNWLYLTWPPFWVSYTCRNTKQPHFRCLLIQTHFRCLLIHIVFSDPLVSKTQVYEKSMNTWFFKSKFYDRNVLNWKKLSCFRLSLSGYLFIHLFFFRIPSSYQQKISDVMENVITETFKCFPTSSRWFLASDVNSVIQPQTKGNSFNLSFCCRSR